MRHARAIPVIGRLIEAGQWTPGDPDVLIICDAGYNLARLAYLLADLPVEVIGRLRSDRVLRLPAPERVPGTNGRPASTAVSSTSTSPAPGPKRSTPPTARRPAT